MRKRPRDPNQLAKSIVGIATGEIEDRGPSPSRSKAGAKGGAARAKALGPAKRRQIARKAAAERWGKK